MGYPTHTPATSSYVHPGNNTAFPAYGSAVAAQGRGPVDAYIIGSTAITASIPDYEWISASIFEIKPGVAITASITPSTIVNTRTISISGTVFSLSSTFTASDWNIIFGPQDVMEISNLAITIINNHPVSTLISGSVEWSPNNVNYETDWDVTTFLGLAPGGINYMQISSNSRK
jgi:hypothetical protein